MRCVARLVLLGLSFAGTAGYLAYASRPERTPPRMPFAGFPSRIGEWIGRSAPDFDSDVVTMLGVDEFVNRYYRSGPRFAHLYVGYYGSQRQGSTMHSPMNCLPGAGWVPGDIRRLVISSPTTDPMTVNRLVVQKGLDKQVVLYWYQSHGRTIASEYWSKAYLVLDSIRLHRSDAALVRIMVPVDTGRADGEAAAEGAAVDLAEGLFPAFARYLPS